MDKIIQYSLESKFIVTVEFVVDCFIDVMIASLFSSNINRPHHLIMKNASRFLNLNMKIIIELSIVDR